MALKDETTSASAAITLIPGDAGTPIAEKLADLSSYFLISLSAIYLEKYLLVLSNYAVFGILLPLGCIVYLFNIYSSKKLNYALLNKLLIFSISIILVVPASVGISNVIENTFETSFEKTIQMSENTTKEITENKGDDDFLTSLWNRINTSVTGATSEISSILNQFIESVAVLIVTSCIIPVLVLIFFLWLIKTFLGVNIDPNRMRLPGKRTERQISMRAGE